MMGKNQLITIGIELINDPNWMGGTLYLSNLAVCLSRLPAPERPQIQLLGSPEVLANFFEKWGPLPGLNSQAESLFDRIARRLGIGTQPAASIDVVYPGFGATLPGAVTIRWIPDFQHRYLPHLFSSEEIAARDHSIGEIAARPGVVVFSSQTARADFLKFYPEHQVTPRVWHFCSLLDTNQAVPRDLQQKYRLPDKYLYLPNQFWSHKNHITVLKALAYLRREHGLTIPLVCTGAQSDRRNQAHVSTLLKLIEDDQLSEQVLLLGLIERTDQVGILRYAAAVVQPSLFEGWSTVVEDVRATGRPIFLSDLAVHREQNPPHCHYFSPESVEELAHLLKQQWPQLSPGPDPMAEARARQEMNSRILDSARSFCDIAYQAKTIR